MNLTAEALKALINTNSPRQGAIVTADIDVMFELFESGIVAKGGGLTRKGTIARERAITALEDAMFS